MSLSFTVRSRRSLSLANVRVFYRRQDRLSTGSGNGMSKSLATIKTAPSEATSLVETVQDSVPNAKQLAARNRTSQHETNRQRSIDTWHVVRNALLKAVDKRDETGLKAVERMANAVVDKAVTGDMQAVAFLTERIDGKVVTPVDIKQDITVSSIGEAHLHALNRLTAAVTRHDEVTTIEGEATPKSSEDS